MTMPSSIDLDIVRFEELSRNLSRPQTDDIIAIVFILLAGTIYTLRGILWDKPDPYHHVWFEKPQDIDGEGKNKADTRDIEAKLADGDKKAVIFWGSQSGTAEGLANKLQRDLRSRFRLDTMTADLSDYDTQTIANISRSRLAIFIISTYGEGDPSDNASQTMSFLNSADGTQFSNLKFVTFGLGNKNYRLYNRVIDVLAENLQARGATSLLPIGRGDDSKGTTEEDFAEWKRGLFQLLNTDFGYVEHAEQYIPSLKVVEDRSLDIADLHIGEPQHKGNSVTTSLYQLTVVRSKRLLRTLDRNFLHLEFDIGAMQGLKYKTGDHLAVWPSNPISEVYRLIRVLGLESRKDAPLIVTSIEASTKCNIPSPTTIFVLLQHYLEICAPVSRETVSALAQFASTTSSKTHLLAISRDKNVYSDYCSKKHVTFGRLLQDGLDSEVASDWSQLPLSFLLETLPLLTPRYYSISSSAIVQPHQIAITVATSVQNNNNLAIPGLTTSYLESYINLGSSVSTNPAPISPSTSHSNSASCLKDGSVFAHIRSSKFRLPVAPATPIIMVAAGSGIAPFRAFITERARLLSFGKPVGTTKLFFGCRSSTEDFLYQNELTETMQGMENVLDLVTAFSRTETNSSGGKMYVQDRIEEQGKELLRLLVEEEACLYICGSTTMAREVGERIRGLLKGTLHWDEEKIKLWSGRMRKSRKWQEDVWG
ncbi:NADPH-cytochrome P450 reductase 2 [Phlyctema vagabunda]|uniref:NADPH--cytochrome P450 reductase n=1 Tax=Phlyctema vagabunda TaxID=108571 RepID=A0ABR4PE39_9HELO